MEAGVSKDGGKISPASSCSVSTGEIALRGQVVTPRQHKTIRLLSVSMLLLALAGFCYSLVFKTTSARLLFLHPHVQGVNISFATINLTALGFLLILFSYNMSLVHRARLCWNKRKRTIVYVALAQLVVQFLNSVFFLLPNVHSIAVPCSWFQDVEFASGFIRWTCWNSLFCLFAIQAHIICPWLESNGTIKRMEVDGKSFPLLIMDGRFWVHLPKLFIWACFEFCIVYLAAAYPDSFDFDKIEVQEPGQTCNEYSYKCKTGAAYKTLTTVWILFLALYVLIIHAYIRQTRQRLLLAPYKDLIHVHLMVRRLKTQVWALSGLGLFLVPFLWYTRWQRCNNYFVAWLGLLPFQVIATSVVLINAFYFMPMPPGDDSIQQIEMLYQKLLTAFAAEVKNKAWLQEFAWLESDEEAAIQKRAAYNPAKAGILLKEPMFCFETAVKLLLWSELVYYDYSEEGKPVAVEAAGALPAAASADVLAFLSGSTAYEKDSIVDIKPEGFSPGLDVEAAGTKGEGVEAPLDAKAPELLADEASRCRALLQVAMEMYDLEEYEIIHEQLLETRVLIAWSSKMIVVAFRGTAGMANVWSDAKPMVHKGFLETWTVNNLDKRVVQRIQSIASASKVAPQDFKIYLTGHSLGGALATLAAIDLQRTSRFPQLYVYTYGAPRTGNHAFAAEYESMVPHTWHVINDRDAVPRSGKFWIMYKRPGQRVLINQVGDIRVRPAVLEVCLHSAGFSIKQHYMASYLRSLWGICVAQCMEFKEVLKGAQAVKALAASPQMQAYFATIDVDIQELAQMPPEQVQLSSIVNKQAKLKRGWCNIGILDYFASLFEDLLPISDNTVATLSLMNQPKTADEASAAEALEQEEGIARRMSVLSLQRQLSSVGRRSALEGPSSVLASSAGPMSVGNSSAALSRGKSSFALESRPSRQGREIGAVIESPSDQ